MVEASTKSVAPSLPPELITEFEAFLVSTVPVSERVLSLADRLAQHSAWGPLHKLALTAIERLEDADSEVPPPWPRFLLKAAEELAQAPGGAEVLSHALATAHQLLPRDSAIALRHAAEIEKGGDLEGGLAVVGRALEALRHSSDHAALDGILMKLLEAGDADRLKVALPTLGSLLRKGELARILPFLDLAQATILRESVRDQAWSEVARAARELPPADGESVRPILVRLAGARYGDVAGSLLQSSGIEPKSGTLSEAVARFEDLALRAPGTYHEHNSWGVGRVLLLEANAVTLDFPKRAGQRMTLAAAMSALTPLLEGDVRVLAAWRPEELERLRREDPADIVARLLATLKREATAAEMKKLLISWGTVPQASWTSFWQSTKKKLADDPRIDASHAFEARYALAREGQGVRLPAFPKHETPRKAMALLKRLLGQHPELRSRLDSSWGEGLLRWAASGKLELSDRVAALAWAAELTSDKNDLEAQGVSLLAHAFEREFDLAELPGTMEQRKALDWSLRGPSWERAARSALATRLADLREAAFAAIEERHGADAPAFWDALWLDAATTPTSALYAMEHADPARKPVASLARANPWAAVRGLVNLLESTPEEPVTARARALLAPDGWLVDAVRTHEAGEDLETLLTRRCLTWKTTQRNLEPIVLFAREVGLTRLVTRVEEARRERARAVARPTDDAAAGFTGRNYMTRRVFERTHDEIEQLETALKTSIPEAIQKARELGDLSENAEYHAAKQKQKQAEARIALLSARLVEVLLIDDTPPERGVAGPGTEVEVALEDGTGVRYWVLGEGDGELGPEVVSYRAAVGRALLGRRVGDSVSWSSEGREIKGTVRTIRPRPPG